MDLIDRQKAIDALGEQGLITAMIVVDCLPSAQPDLSGYSDRLWKAAHERGKAEAQRTGKWERHYSRPNVYADLYWHCSECGYKNDDQNANVYHKFCPNCGAKMEAK